MRVAKLSIEGIGVLVAKTTPPTKPGGSPFYCLSHGSVGKGRWEVRLPLSSKDFPSNEQHPAIELLDDNFDLLVMENRRDLLKNPGLILTKGQSDNRYLLLWHLSPGVNGTSYYKVEGNAEVLSKGLINRDDGNKKTATDCPIVLVSGACVLTWYRDGNVYGQQRAWCAIYDGRQWSIVPKQEDWMRVYQEMAPMEEEE